MPTDVQRVVGLRGDRAIGEDLADLGVEAVVVPAMPAADQRFRVDEGLLRFVAHAVGRVAVLQNLSRDEAHAAPLRLGHQGVH